MNSKSDRRVQITKMFLREALLNLMKEKPIGKITPTELCRNADINRNTFYAHYTCPMDLLAEIEEELYRDIMSYMTDFTQNGLRLNDICKAIKEHSDLCTVICSDYGDSAFLYRLISDAYKVTIDDWKAIMPNIRETELESYFTFCANGSVAVIRKWLERGADTPYEEIAKILEKATGALLWVLQNEK